MRPAGNGRPRRARPVLHVEVLDAVTGGRRRVVDRLAVVRFVLHRVHVDPDERLRDAELNLDRVGKDRAGAVVPTTARAPVVPVVLAVDGTARGEVRVDGRGGRRGRAVGGEGYVNRTGALLRSE